ncbi:hypothetical protein ABGT16_05270 [Pseudomonas asiatica]|uniref:hypothetical protein n=1 Tax=Pseudomonas asiatica TaxID=2219225 RepID=UPI00345DDB8E
MTDTNKYIRTEPPAMLEGPLTLELSDLVIEALNAYRQARHAFMAGHRDGTPGGNAEGRDTYEQRAISLASYLNLQIGYALDEPSDWAAADS